MNEVRCVVVLGCGCLLLCRCCGVHGLLHFLISDKIVKQLAHPEYYYELQILDCRGDFVL